jgi:hypothetical protein
MTSRSVFITLACASATPALAGTVLTDDFNNLSQWKDLSTAITWGGNAGPVSAFETTGGEVSLTTSAMSNGGYTATNSLKTFTALDHQFSTPINRAQNMVELVARIKWATPGTSSGESNRFNITFTHDYPAGGLDLDLNDRYDDVSPASDAWWARPAYQARVRGSTTTTGKTILQYGGGGSTEGEWEIYNNTWWLPGFSSAPGGGSPGVPPSEGWELTNTGLASASYQTLRYVLHPDYQSVWIDTDNDGVFDPGENGGTQDLTGTLANFDHVAALEGLRLYWRAADANSDVFLDSISVSTTLIPEPASLVMAAIGAAGLLRRRR